jgi:hypothetical protein
MKFINANMKYFKEAVDIAFETYRNEFKCVNGIGNCNKNEIEIELAKLFQNHRGILCIEGENLLGYVVYNQKWNSNGKMQCMLPFVGYGAVGKDRVKIMSMLFQTLAKQLCTEQKVNFEVKLYAHDYEIIQLFSFLQFGIICEEGICYTDKYILCNKIADTRELTKKEIIKRWNEIWGLLQNLIEHLRKSPVFYPGTEFTESVYKDYLLDNNTRLFIGEIKDRIVGVITANKDGNSFVNNQTDCYNVGDVYVVPKYRGSMVAQSMLKYVSDILRHKNMG